MSQYIIEYLMHLNIQYTYIYIQINEYILKYIANDHSTLDY
jgi:hypothetical protein